MNLALAPLTFSMVLAAILSMQFTASGSGCRQITAVADQARLALSRTDGTRISVTPSVAASSNRITDYVVARPDSPVSVTLSIGRDVAESDWAWIQNCCDVPGFPEVLARVELEAPPSALLDGLPRRFEGRRVVELAIRGGSIPDKLGVATRRLGVDAIELVAVDCSRAEVALQGSVAREVSLHSSFNVTPDAASALMRGSDLEGIRFLDCRGGSGGSVRLSEVLSLDAAPRLSLLRLDGLPGILTDREGLELLAQREFRCLGLRLARESSPSHQTRCALEALGDQPRLEELHLAGGVMDMEDMQWVLERRGLERLEIVATDLVGELDLDHGVTRLERVVDLALVGVDRAADVLDSLMGSKVMSELELSDCTTIGDASVLAVLTTAGESLVSLDLSGTSVTAACLDHLSRFSQLRVLDVQLTAIEPAELVEFAREHPALVVIGVERPDD